MRHIKLAPATLCGSYSTAVMLLWLFQREIIYSPDRTEYVPPSHYSMLAGVEEISLETVDGFGLTAWYAPAPTGRPTIVMFLGKSGSLRSQRYRLQHFKVANMGVLLLAYRGYSGNPGSPNEKGLYADARSAIDWLESHGIDDRSIVLYGASLGSGVATEMALERRFAAVVLEAPYTSIADVAALRLPIVPVRWLLKDRFDSLARMGGLTEPLLVMHGDGDSVIPQRLGRALFTAAHTRKEGFWPHGVGHNDIFDRGGFDAALNFIERSLRSYGPSGTTGSDVRTQHSRCTIEQAGCIPQFERGRKPCMSSA